MYFYNFHIADFNAATRHLTHLERAFYRDLIDMYYDTEKAITGDLPHLWRKLIIKTEEEKEALQSVLDEFFVLKKGAYYHKRIAKEIKNYRYKHGNATPANNDKVTDGNGDGHGGGHVNGHGKSNGNALTEAQRQARYKARKKMVQDLVDKGVEVPKGVSFEVINTLYCSHFGGNATPANNEKVTDGNGKDHEKNAARTINQEPITKNHESVGATAPTHTAKNSKSETIKLWQAPKLDVINQRLKSDGFGEAISQDDLARHLSKFCNYYANREQQGNFLATEEVRMDKFIAWIMREKPVFAAPSSEIGTPAGGDSYSDHLARIVAENRAFNEQMRR